MRIQAERLLRKIAPKNIPVRQPPLSIDCFIAGVADTERGRTGELVQQWRTSPPAPSPRFPKETPTISHSSTGLSAALRRARVSVGGPVSTLDIDDTEGPESGPVELLSARPASPGRIDLTIRCAARVLVAASAHRPGGRQARALASPHIGSTVNEGRHPPSRSVRRAIMRVPVSARQPQYLL